MLLNKTCILFSLHSNLICTNWLSIHFYCSIYISSFSHIIHTYICTFCTRINNIFQTSQKQPSLGNALCKSICEERHFTLSDFSILENVGSVKTVAGNFYSATHDSTETNDDNNADIKVDSGPNMSKTIKLPVTLLISDDEQVMSNSKNQFSLSAAFSFQDGVNRHILSDSIGKSSIWYVLIA